MDLQRARIGLLVPDPTPVWTGSALGEQSASFVLMVSTSSGSLDAGMAGMVLVREGQDLMRIKAVVGLTLTLAENAAPFELGDSLEIFALRLPFPRYQRLDGTDVYKDWDVPFPATWQHTLPPIAVVTPECAWLRLGETLIFDAQASRAMSAGASVGVTATWDAGSWGSTNVFGSENGVSGNYCDLTPTEEGFHYLALTITDEFGGSLTHFLPVWVGESCLEVLSFSADWALGQGWRGQGQCETQFSYLAHSPVALVDLESRDVLLFGFLSPQSLARSFGTESFDFEILSPLQDARLLQGFPFIVTDVADPGSSPPTDWSEVGELSVARATWFLLVWHTLLPTLINVELGVPSERRIKGQKFPAGALPGLLDEIVGSAFLVLRAARSGGLALGRHPLYASEWWWTTGFNSFALSAVQRHADYELHLPAPQAMDVRLSGVYLDYLGDYQPAICRCPAHPDNWGRGGTAEVTNLAPISETELQLWAGRHFAIENLLPTLSLTLFADVDPFAYELLATDVPEAPLIAIESLHLRFDAEQLNWEAQLDGRPYGHSLDAIAVPVPDPVDIPPPTTPPVTPPLPPLPPLPVPCPWPARLFVATRARGIYYTDTFSGPDGSQPTWALLSGTDAYDIKCADISPLTGSVFVACDTGSSFELYRWTDGGGYESVLTNAEVLAIIGEASAAIHWVHVDVNGYVLALCSGYQSVHILRSTSDGARNAGQPSFVAVSDLGVWPYSIGNLLSAPDFGIAGINKTGGGGSGRIFTGVVGSDSWQYSDNLGGLLPTAYYDAHNNRVYTLISGWEMRRLATDLYTIETPLALAGEVGVLGGFSRGFPAFYAWNTNLHATVGVYGTDYENSIQWSDDAWETFSSSGDVGRVIEMLVGIPTHPGNLILGRYSPPSAGQYHVIYANDDLGATMPVERAGVDPNNAATTVSIPFNCGGIAYNGILLPPDYCEV